MKKIIKMSKPKQTSPYGYEKGDDKLIEFTKEGMMGEEKKLKKIEDWINEMLKKDVKKFETAFEMPFGFVIMKDGRKAQITLNLELDEEEWFV